MLLLRRIPPAPPAPPAAPEARLTALDRLRGALVGLVVLHHAVLAYCTFGHVDCAHYALSTAPIVDPERWRGFDGLVLLDDAFFMPLLFLLSGLFVRDGLARKGAGAYLRGRARRLGLPFAVAVTTLMPLAYYPSYLQAGGRAGFAAFWVRTVTTGPWPSGPPWFIGVLLAFDAAAALLFVLRTRDRAGRAFAPGRDFLLLVGLSGLAYLPLLLAVGPALWIGIGPLAIQASRIGLYAVYFAAGVALGRGGRPALLDVGRALAARWRSWVLLALASGAALVAATAIGGRLPAREALVLEGAARTLFCAAAALALPVLFLRFGGGRSGAWDSLSANAFAIYLLHYPAVTWVQAALLGLPLGAPFKGAIVFVVAFAASWGGAWALRRSPRIRRLL
ncbi:Acyltransferase family protein [Methylobacterium sp. 174MFSha1.1]|uniref:acyltransferase family protein n=1 Tax=Methylobacterium sp. 174MFSha1.1 TaxID=1502749 RepID=UPI0008F2E3D6|nr:acyltransferase [Methylobacterium sp. 174MFSha1.1]SFU85450.1 Acyltransferase family protein [Methylobacterium sp. 174MFSha1.1]